MNYSNDAAIINISGVLTQRPTLLTALMGGTSTHDVSRHLRQALAEKSVKRIILNVDSPGGGFYGIQELAREIFRARSKKHIIAVANSLAGGAAYWLASQASEVVVTPGGDIGSIGVIAAHADWSSYVNEPAAGVAGLPKITYIAAGKFKAEANPYEPLSEAARAAIQKRTNEIYDAFVKGVAKGRRVLPGIVVKDYAGGRLVGARQAVNSGLADRISTLEDILMSSTSSPRLESAMSRLALVT